MCIFSSFEIKDIKMHWVNFLGNSSVLSDLLITKNMQQIVSTPVELTERWLEV